MAPRGSHERDLHAGDAAADHHDAFRFGQLARTQVEALRVLGLAARTGVERAVHRMPATALARTAAQARDARDDVLGATLRHLHRKLRVGQRRAPHAHEIGSLRCDELFGDGRVGNPADYRDRYIDDLLELTGGSCVESRRDRGGRRDDTARCGRPLGDVEQVDTRGPYHPSKGPRLVRAVASRYVVASAEAERDREIGADGVANGAYDLEREASPVLEGSPVLVTSLVAGGREELVDQIPVGAVNLDQVEARLFRAPRRGSERIHHEADVVAAHFARRALRRRIAKRRGPHEVLARIGGVCNAPGVEQLRTDGPARLMDAANELGMGRDLGIVPQGGKAHMGLPLGDDRVVLGDHKAPSAARLLLVEADELLGR